MKKLLSIILALMMLISTITVAGTSAYAKGLTKGKCGENITYSFNKSTGELKLSGTGKMYDNLHNAFSSNSSIKSVVFSDSITKISDYAFDSCENLKTVKFPKKLKAIGNLAFESCKKLDNIVLPGSINSIGSFVFDRTAYYNNEENWVNGGTKQRVLYIGHYLIKVDEDYRGALNIRKGTKIIADYACNWCSGITQLAIPDSVVTIGGNAFNECTKIKKISIPESVKIIGENPFTNTDLNTISVNKNNKIFDSRGNCNAVIRKKNNQLISGTKNTIFSKTVKSIGAYAFAGCRMKSIAIPSTVNTIGKGAFRECYYLKKIALPKGLKKIDDEVFLGCINLKKISLPKGIKSIGYNSFGSCGIVNAVIPEGVISIGEAAFFSAHNLKSVKLSKSLKKIGNSAFEATESDIDNIYYSGTLAQWNKIRIASENKFLDEATLHCKDGNFTKIKSITFTSVKKSKKKGAIRLKWKPIKNVSGYQIRYSTNEDFAKKATKTITIKNPKTATKVIKRIKGNKEYYVSIRTYRIKNRKTHYSTWRDSIAH